MKAYNVDDLVKIIEKQQGQIEMLEKQVNILLTADKDKPKENVKMPDAPGDTNTRIQDIEDVVTDLKGDMMELMLVYQDIQDKIFDIDRWVKYPFFTTTNQIYRILRTWQNTLVFHNIKSDSSYESSECTESRLRDLLKSVLNIRYRAQNREIFFH